MLRKSAIVLVSVIKFLIHPRLVVGLYKLIDYSVRTCKDIIQECTMQCPLNCPICFTGQMLTYWKYQFMTHIIIQKHLAESNELLFIPLQLLVTTHITKGEEMRMGIRLVKTEE